MEKKRDMDTNLQKYRAFLLAVECGSFTRAAERLHYSQSGVSRMIGDLEKEWQTALLERGRGGVKLTSEGQKLLPHIRRLCAAHEALQAEVDALAGLRSGLIRIGTFSSTATHWAPNIIRAFQRRYPGIEYELLLGDYGEIETWIDTGRVDCGFLRLPARLPLETIPLAEDPLLAVLPEGHPLARGEMVSAAALCAEPFLLLEKGGRAEAADVFARCGVRPNVRFTTWDDYAILSMVESGLGVSILPKLILKRIPYRVAVRPLDVPASRTIGLALRSRAHAPEAVRRFLDYLPFREAPLGGPASE